MIKVQPARSRIVKTETPDRLTLVKPRGSADNVGEMMMLLGVGWIVVAIGLLFHPFLKSLGHLTIVSGIIMVPGIVLLVSGLAIWKRTWTLERSADGVVFTRGGVWGTSVRKWPAEDVSSFWVEQVRARRGSPTFILMIGFRNGRSEDVLTDRFEEEVRWLAAILKDSRGSRRPAGNTGRAAAEPVQRRMDPSVVPVSLASRRLPSGAVELKFLPLIDSRRRWLKLLGTVSGGLLGIVLVSSLLVWLLGDAYPAGLSRLAVGVLLAVVFFRFMTLNRTAGVTIDNGIVTIVQNQHRGNHQFPAEEVEFIQTFRASGATELQFLLRGMPKLRLFEGRPPEELEWAARFLRVALKHRADEEEAPMKVDAAVGDCQVCSEKMESRVIYCAKCRTPHHEECWSYVGQCSTYGCREIRFTRA